MIFNIVVWYHLFKQNVNVAATYWTPGLSQKGPLKQGWSVLPFVLPSVRKFSWNWLISFFPEIQHGVRVPYIVVCDRAGFFGKNPHWAKMTKNGQKWPKNRVFGLFKKIMSLVLSGICLKQKFLWFHNIIRKLVLKLQLKMAFGQ